MFFQPQNTMERERRKHATCLIYFLFGLFRATDARVSRWCSDRSVNNFYQY